LSINGKRIDITLADLLTIADTYTIKNAKKVVQEIKDAIAYWKDQANELNLPAHIVHSICRDFVKLL
jgi:serine/threonine-protein kinase HipA